MEISLIIPIFNVEKFIPDCLNSLLSQDIDIKDYEIICIDDGSLDQSSQVVAKYQNQYNNIKLINIQNSGVSNARNIGLKAATGKYVWFIDPDD